jgi:hypothetical protein
VNATQQSLQSSHCDDRSRYRTQRGIINSKNQKIEKFENAPHTHTHTHTHTQLQLTGITVLVSGDYTRIGRGLKHAVFVLFQPFLSKVFVEKED